MREYRWIAWNIGHIGRHGVTPDEAEWIINRARSPFPRRLEEDKRLVRGQTAAGRYLQVIYVLDPDKTVFVIHARPLTENEKRRLRKRSKGK